MLNLHLVQIQISIPMPNLYDFILKTRFYFLFVLLYCPSLFSQTVNDKCNQNSEITIFVIPSVTRINWENPSILFKSTMDCYWAALFQKNYYVIGHTIARISSPILPAPVFVAMSGAVQTEKIDLVIFKGLGMGSVGSTIKGHIEPEASIKRGLKLYASRNKVAFIKFKVTENSIRRVLEYVDGFGKNTNQHFASCQIYNGALWPRHKNEGSGCSAFGMALLDVVNILPKDTDWFMNVKIPMQIIGGEFNNNKKVTISSIKKTKSWYNGNGIADVDYVNYKVFDPSLIFDWIIKKRSQNDMDFQPSEENGLLGLVVDRQNMIIDASEPVFSQRNDSNLFVKHYYRKLHDLGL